MARIVAYAMFLAIGLLLCPKQASATPGNVAEERRDEAASQPRSKGLTFIDHTGRAVSERDFSGRYMLVFFGYTHCPDVCPGDLAIMSAAMRELGGAAESVQPVFITFDPVRDTPAVLAEYVRHFHPRLTGLTGTAEQIAAATRSYGVLFEEVESGGEVTASSEYSLRHTALTYSIGPGGKGATTFDHGSDPREMAARILAILQPDSPAATARGMR